MIWTMTEIFIDSVVNCMLRPICCFTSLARVLSTQNVHFLELSPHRSSSVLVQWYVEARIVTYNNAVRLLLQVRRRRNANQLFVFPTCEALLRHLLYHFMCCLDESRNSIKEDLTIPWKSCSHPDSEEWWESLHMSCFLNRIVLFPHFKNCSAFTF